MRRHYVLPLMWVGLAIAPPSFAQKDDVNTKAKAELVAFQKDLAERFAKTHAGLTKYRQALAQVDTPTNRQLAKKVDVALKWTGSADTEVRKLSEVFAIANLDRNNDLQILLAQSENCMDRISAAMSPLRDGLGVVDQRVAYEEQLAALRKLDAAQYELRKHRDDPSLDKKQKRIMEESKALARSLLSEGKGTGKIGTHQERLATAFQQVDKAQEHVLKSIGTKDEIVLGDAIWAASSALYRAARETNDIVFLLRIVEHRHDVQALARQLGETQKSTKELLTAVADVAEEINKNPKESPTPALQRECLKLADRTKTLRRALDKTSMKFRTDPKPTVLADLLANISAEVERLQRRLEITDVGPESVALGRSVLANAERLQKLALEIDRTLAALEPGEIGNPRLAELLALVAELESSESEYQQLVERIRLRIPRFLELFKGP